VNTASAAQANETGTGLIHYDAMCRAIDAAYAVAEVKAIHDQAQMLQAAARVAKNVEAETRAYEIRMRAARKAGALSKKIEKAKTGPNNFPGHSGKTRTLVDAGISTQQASEWERLSDVPQDEFETAPAEKSVRELIDKPTPVSDDALMLISTLRQFRWRGYLAMAASPAFRAAPEDSQASSGSRIFAICNAAF
jgi:hypothetical protein